MTWRPSFEILRQERIFARGLDSSKLNCVPSIRNSPVDYLYDPATKRLNSIVAGGKTYTYDKDKAYQLKTAERKQVWAGGSAVLNTYGYAFDGIGNRTDRNYAANSANQYKKNPDAANADIDYDLRGNMTSDGVFDFTWNSANQLTSATPRTVVTLEQETTAHEQGNDLPASRKVEFGYDDSGRRIWKKSYVYSSAAILFADTGSEKELTYAYLPLIRRWLAHSYFPPLTVVRYRPRHVPYHTPEGNLVKNATLPGATFNRDPAP